MIKRILLLIFVALAVLILTSIPAHALEVVVQDEKIEFEVAPQLDNGRAFVAVRPVAAKLGAQVVWSPSARTVTVTRGDINLVLAVGGTTAYLNDQPVQLEIPSRIVEGRTLVPVRILAELLGENIIWDASEQGIYIGDRELPFEVLKGSEWVTPEPVQGQWHLSVDLPYQDFAVIQSPEVKLSKPPQQTVLPPPQTDYEKYLVLWAYLGEAPTGGYSIHFSSILRQGDILLVKVHRVSPGPGQIVTEAFTYPEAAARIERGLVSGVSGGRLTVRFVDQDENLLKELVCQIKE
ncbi:stalk domain-containing protein [Thermanaeromonas sp. C210]|uniref:stalk domain-containing protein n=1 Tax=Thermanaeromonas sp. C210 TaxID=2731925 RepID=UPI00155C0B15|nr:stalk domain-containing protein [Thermanaeromonas sp. C210]GFN22034.1 hypothetical protein TAMC210_03500 [Thermanaeromonas sp. C210]